MNWAILYAFVGSLRTRSVNPYILLRGMNEYRC
jgi:hypothetical protein